jgi:hypothetical protein
MAALLPQSRCSFGVSAFIGLCVVGVSATGTKDLSILCQHLSYFVSIYQTLSAWIALCGEYLRLTRQTCPFVRLCAAPG